MKPSRIALDGLLLGFLVCGFTCDLPQRSPIATVSGAAHGDKPDHETTASIFEGVAQMLRAKGFQGGHQHQPSGYRLPGGREYSDGFWLDPGIGCTVEIIRKSASIDFYELESPRHSGNFPATDNQRAIVKDLAYKIKTYLRARLPESYEVRVVVIDLEFRKVY